MFLAIFDLAAVALLAWIPTAPVFGGGCDGLGVVMIAWGSVPPLALTAVLLLVHARTGSWFAAGVGVLATLVAAWHVIAVAGANQPEMFAHSLLFLPTIAQLPLGLMLIRSMRSTLTVATA